jgi:hypothetical protein
MALYDAHGTLYIDNSTDSALARCTTQALLRYGLDVVAADADDSPFLTSGIAAHAALASYMRHGIAETALSVFADGDQEEPNPDRRIAYQAWAMEHIDPAGPLARLTYENTSRILAQWMDTHPLHLLPFKPQANLVEVGFAWPLDQRCVCGHTEADHYDGGACLYCACDGFHPRFMATGRMDLIAPDRDTGRWWVIDHKTTGKLDERWRQSWRMDSQMSRYTWSAEQHLDDAVAGCFVNGIQFSKLPGSDRKCYEHGVPYHECSPLHATYDMLIVERTPVQLTQWHANAIRFADTFRKLTMQRMHLAGVALEEWPHDVLDGVPMEGMFNTSCRDCQFASFCALGRPIEYARTMLRHEPWRPFELPKEAAA